MGDGFVGGLFRECIRLYEAAFGFGLSYMSWQFSEIPRHKDSSPCFDFPPDEYGGSWLEDGSIDLNPDPESVMRRYGLIGRMSVADFLVTIISHELAHEVWKNVAGDGFKYGVVSKAVEEGFTTAYLDSLDSGEANIEEETFCEYMASQILALRKGGV